MTLDTPLLARAHEAALQQQADAVLKCHPEQGAPGPTPEGSTATPEGLANAIESLKNLKSDFPIHLGGSGKARKVELHVTVDGQEGAALGVMSQGELHSLALSLFIPRATLPESPFRFVVIDDPVQSMDPARVDGLARVLQAASQDRQVVVFTHDDRLPEAVRRLDIDAPVIEVTRREGSLVQTRRSKDPVSRYLDDAFALAKTDDLPPDIARRVIGVADGEQRKETR